MTRFHDRIHSQTYLQVSDTGSGVAFTIWTDAGYREVEVDYEDSLRLASNIAAHVRPVYAWVDDD